MNNYIYPMVPKAIGHRHGGVITTVHRIGHRPANPRNGFSFDTWFFVVDVEWDDGTKSALTEVHPGDLCADSENKDLVYLLEAMNSYLAANGTWFSDGSHRGWFATDRIALK